jgi:hypothetical protein
MLIQGRLVAYGLSSTLGISTLAINPKGFYVTSGKDVHPNGNISTVTRCTLGIQTSFQEYSMDFVASNK